MVRRVGLTVVLFVIGLALIDGAVVHQLPRSWVPAVLATVDRYVGSEGSALGAVFGLGLILTAFSPYRNRLWVNLAILYGVFGVAVQVDRYYTGRGDVVPPIIFWVATTALVAALYPTRPRPVVTAPARRPPAPVPASPAAGASTAYNRREPPGGGASSSSPR